MSMYIREAKSIHKWFADSMSLQIMLTDSSPALKLMLTFPTFVLRVPCSKIVVAEITGFPDLELMLLICSSLRSQFPFGFSVSYLSNSLVIVELGQEKTTDLRLKRPALSLVILAFWKFGSSRRCGLSATANSFIMSMNMMR